MTNQQDNLTILGSPVHIQNFGGEFLILRGGEKDRPDLSRLGRALFERQFHFVEEVIATETEICLKLNRRFDDRSMLELERLESTARGAAAFDEAVSETTQVLRLPVWFSKTDDWEAVCRFTGLDRSAYLQKLLECQFRVAMIGFLPGFVYLNGLSEALHVPRKANPDRHTEADSFAVGGTYAGIYSLPSPAGWNVLGRLGISLLQTEQLPPVQLQPGDAVLLNSVDRTEYQNLVRTKPTLREYNG